MFHPAALLLVWMFAILGVQWLDGMWLLACLAVSVAGALGFAPARTLGLLNRTRWLLLSLAGVFLFGTPGEYLQGIAGSAGLTREGVHLAFEQISRLLILLCSLGVLHHRIGTAGMLSGLHCLLTPFPARDTTVVRLMLVLELVEARQPGEGWRDWLIPANSGKATVQVIPLRRLQRPDYLLLGLMLLLSVCGWLS